MGRAMDFLAFGAHPDDAEIGVGAFLLKMKAKGYRTGIVSLTEGDMGAGTRKVRRREAAAAARILEVDAFEVLHLGDTRLEDTPENRRRVAAVIRKYRPRILLAPHYAVEPGRGRGHADHIAAGHLVTHAANFAHLEKFPAGGRPHAVQKIFYYFMVPFARPSFIVPVDHELPRALEAVAAHASQFGRAGYRSVPSRLEVVARYFGLLAGCTYGQAFYTQEIFRIDDPFVLFQSPDQGEE
ncbi:MAG TPA: PIG-L family deacetylase [Candidatus Methylomirabilis sp.]|nr:PIG-L family deacetylase [Candidatus Methylomirabilis sp.]